MIGTHLGISRSYIPPLGLQTVYLSNSNDNSMGALSLLAVLAILIVWLATRFGIGITPDSTVYIDAAHNLLNGRGLIALTGRGEFQPLTHYPPLYPAVLALLARVGSLPGGLPLESAARMLNSFLCGANILLVGVAIKSYTRNSYWLPIIGSSLTLTAPDIAGIHTFALTEGLFVFLSLSGLLSLSRFIETERRPWLIGSAVMMAMAFLTRYVGVTLLFTGVLVLLFMNGRAFRRRCCDALSLGLIACAPMVLWSIRNMRVVEGMSDREFVFHPIKLGQIVVGLSTVSSWFLLGKVRTDYRAIVFAFEVVAASLFVIYLLRSSRGKAFVNQDHFDEGPTDQVKTLRKRPSSSPLPSIFLVFIVTYLAFLIFTATFIDADMVLDDRALVPVHVAAIVMVSCFAWKLFEPVKERRSIQIGFVALALILLGSYSIRGARRLMQARQDGQGYASRAWKESKTIAHVKNLPAGVPIYSNGYDAIYYLTNRPAIYIPEKVKHGTGLVNENYDTEVGSMGKALKERGGRLVYFNTLPERWFLPPEVELKQQLKLRSLETNVDGSVYEWTDCEPR
jgi:hypothetical protein